MVGAFKSAWDKRFVIRATVVRSDVTFGNGKFSILAGAAELVRDVQPTRHSGPAWDFAFYAKDLSTGQNVVFPVTSTSHGPLVETTYRTSTPGVIAYGFQGFDIQPTVPRRLSAWIRSVIAKRGWHPTNFH